MVPEITRENVRHEITSLVQDLQAELLTEVETRFSSIIDDEPDYKELERELEATGLDQFRSIAKFLGVDDA